VVATIGQAASGSFGLKLVRRHLAGSSVFGQLEADFLTFEKIAHPGAFDGADVNENVLTTIFRLDETEAFLAIEPLDCASAHDEPLFACVKEPRRRNCAERRESTELGRGHQLAHDTGASVRCGLNVQPKDR
jgi:hypothetical protein